MRRDLGVRMFLDPGIQAGLAVALSAALLLVTAKAHGRQVRLRRELEGYREVTFTGDNPPWVEGLWRRDWRRVWTAYATAVGAILAYVIPASLLGWPRGNVAVEAGLPLIVAIPVAAFLWGPTVGLVVSGTATAMEFRRAVRVPLHEGSLAPGVPADHPAWRSAAARGTWAWWATVSVLASALITTVTF